jgi:flagellar biosynthesis protein FlhG
MSDFYLSQTAALDQADGLRRLFGGARVRHVAVAGNAEAALGGVLLERLTAAFAAMGRHTLIVDAAGGSPAAHELSWVDLAACIERLSPEVSYLAARGLPLRHVDTRGCADGLLAKLADAAPQADVVLVHADAGDLSRLFMRRPIRPVLLAADAPASLTEAYAALKLLAMRNGWLSFDLLLAVGVGSPRGERIASQLASCADRFLGAALHDWAVVDPTDDGLRSPDGVLMRVAAALLEPPDGPALPPYDHPVRAGAPMRQPAWA